jgi:hypothetical protein
MMEGADMMKENWNDLQLWNMNQKITSTVYDTTEFSTSYN